MDVQPVTLIGSVVRLVPLSMDHVPGLARAGRDPRIWKHMVYGDLTTELAMRGFVELLLQRAAQGTDLPFAVIHRQTNQIIGCTRYMDIRRPHRALEIGGTWYAAQHQRTAVNTECKLLLLAHAFEELGCIRVQFKADLRNERSQRAIERLMAVKEGILRQHMILPDGYVRDSVFYSILAVEWPQVKARLQKMLTPPAPE